MDKKEYSSFAGACKAFFGLLPGQSLGDFAAEVRKLTDSDRAEITEGLARNGLVIVAKSA